MEGTASDVVAIEQVVQGLRIVGIVVAAALAPFYRLAHPLLVPLALLPVLVLVVGQHRVIRRDVPIERLRRLARIGLGVDAAALYALGFAFLPDPAWNVYLFYPLIALEASLVLGPRGALLSSALSAVVYLTQAAFHEYVGAGAIDGREAFTAIAMLGMLGSFIAAAGALTAQARVELRVLLDLAEALATQRSETDTIELLDRRLGDAIGGRVRSVALREDDGSYEVVRWRTDERRVIPRPDIEEAIPNVERLEAGFREGQSVTLTVRPGGALARALGLPPEARGVTLVPVQAERRWIGLLPVLWRTEKPPSRQQLKLLNALADNAGVALSQAQLRRVREEAATDALTGLVSRRALLFELDGAIARARRAGTQLSVLFCDLDGFKTVNDRRGHATGDRVLREIATSVRRTAREGDVVGRLGGDELAVVAADTGPVDAVALAERLRAAVRATAGPFGVDVTIGIAAFPDDGGDRNALLAAADDAMYRGKSRGRGQIVRARSPDADGTGGAVPLRAG